MKVLTADNGLKILFRPMKSKIVDMAYFVNVGAIDEKPEHEGYCHALEHMLYAGTENRNWEQINRDWEKLGAYYNAWTGHDKTFYNVNCTKDVWEPAYEILTDIMYNCNFPEERWENIEKPAVISETQAEEDDANWLLEEELYKDALGQRYHPLLGSIENIKKANMQGLKYFYDNYYCGSNIVLSIAGDITEKQILKAVNKYDKLSNKKPPKRTKLDLEFNYDTVSMDKEDLEQCHLLLLKPLPVPRTQKGKVAIDLACLALSQYLFEELREKRGLCYDADASIYSGIPGHSFLEIKTAIDSEVYDKTKEVLLESLDNMSQCFTKERIRNTIIFNRYNTIGASERPELVTRRMWESYREGIEEDPFDFHLDILDKMSESYVRKAAKKAFSGEMKFGKIIEETPNGFWTNLRRRVFGAAV